MNSVLKEILDTREVVSLDGSRLPLSVGTSHAQGLFLQKIIRELKPTVTLEVGLAYGISALFICEALQEVGGSKHIMMDPNQPGWFQNIGLDNLERAGYQSLIEFHLKPSASALPMLVTRGLQIDFAYIDGLHLFDTALIDFFYVDKLLRDGGIVVIDDAHLVGVNKVCKFIQKNCAYSVYAKFWEPELRTNLWKLIRPLFNPVRMNKRTFAPQSIAFRKLGPDTRVSGFHKNF